MLHTMAPLALQMYMVNDDTHHLWGQSRAGDGSHDFFAIRAAALQLLGRKQERECRRAGHRAPHIHVRRGEVVEHARGLVCVRGADCHIQDAPCTHVPPIVRPADQLMLRSLLLQ